MKKRQTQKYFLATALTILSMASCVLAQSIPSITSLPENSPNLVQNAGFEDGLAHWNIPPNTAQVANDAVHQGKNSLYYKNDSVEQYKTFTQEIDAHPGDHLFFSAWVKTKDVVGGKGVGVYMQSADAGGKYINGSFPVGYGGTRDWNRIGSEYIVPTNAAQVSVGLYLQRAHGDNKAPVGTVWFDDVNVQIQKAPIQSFLLFPNYRGTIKQGDNTPWKYEVRVASNSSGKASSANISTKLLSSSGELVFQQEDAVDADTKAKQIILNVPKNLWVGKYTLLQYVEDPNGQLRLINNYPINIVDKMPPVYIDADGFTVVNGKRFFPMGVYLRDASDSSDEDLSRISDGRFNTILSYAYGTAKNSEAYLKQAQAHNLKVVYSIKDLYPEQANHGEDAFNIATKYINSLNDEPALLAWYASDEMGARWLPQLQKMYDIANLLDPNHPTFQVQNKVVDIEAAFNTTDILGADPYPIGRETDLTKTFNDTRSTVEAARGAKGVWIVPQMFNWAVYHKQYPDHPPTLDEMRSQAYQAIIGGAKGLIWYSYFDLPYKNYEEKYKIRKKDMTYFDSRWKDITAVSKEINAIIPMILENKEISLDLPQSANIKVGAWKEGNTLTLLMTNPYYKTNSITFELPEGWKIQDYIQGEIKSTFAGGKATFILSSTGSGAFRLVKE